MAVLGWPHAEQQPSVLSTWVHSMSSLINPLWKRIQSSSQEKPIMWRWQDQRKRSSDLECFHAVALITFLLSCVSKTYINKKCCSIWMWSLMERTPLFLSTEATWDNISYYIFSEVIEACAQRKVPPFCSLWVALWGRYCAVLVLTALAAADGEAAQNDLVHTEVMGFN